MDKTVDKSLLNLSTGVPVPSVIRYVVLKIFIVLIASIVVVFVINIVSKPMIQSLSCNTSDDACRNSKRIQTITVIVRSLVVAIVVVVAIGTILQLIGVNIGSILIAAGIGGIIIGLGAQSVISDILGGITIISENQISEGDYVAVNVLYLDNTSAIIGTVKDINVRMLTLQQDDGSLAFVPNGNIGHIVNFSRTNTNINVKIFVGNETQPNQIQQAISSLLLQLGRYPLYANKYTIMPRLVGVTSSDKSGYYLTIQASASPQDAAEIENFIRSSVLDMLYTYGINTNTVDVNMRQMPTLMGATAGNKPQPHKIVPIPTPSSLTT